MDKITFDFVFENYSVGFAQFILYVRELDPAVHISDTTRFHNTKFGYVALSVSLIPELATFLKLRFGFAIRERDPDKVEEEEEEQTKLFTSMKYIKNRYTYEKNNIISPFTYSKPRKNIGNEYYLEVFNKESKIFSNYIKEIIKPEQTDGKDPLGNIDPAKV